MNGRNQRKPFRHFFISTRIQMIHISRIAGSILLVMLIAIGLVSAAYFSRFSPGHFYFLPDKIQPDLFRSTVWGLIVPCLLALGAASFGAAAYVSLYSSRKVALPVFKVRQWAAHLIGGDLTFKVFFRQGDNLQDLAFSCNQVSKRYAEILRNIQHTIRSENIDPGQKVDEVAKILESIKIQ